MNNNTTLIKERLPKHVAIIMDGNGRWAKKHVMDRIIGYEKGMGAVKAVVQGCRELNISVLTLYAFSLENWYRPPREINALMSLLKKFIRLEIDELDSNDIKIKGIGHLESLPGDVQEILYEAFQRTEQNKSMILNVALSYGGRDEILHAITKLVEKISKNDFSLSDLNEETFSQQLYTAGLPDPDLLIRTSGELRISNFLLWQMAYTEIYVTDVLWPDFGKEDLYKALIEYQKRQRRFGLTQEQLNSG